MQVIPCAIRWLLVSDPFGGLPREAYLRDVMLLPSDILQWFVALAVGVTFQRIRAASSASNAASVVRSGVCAPPGAGKAFSLVTLWAHDLRRSRWFRDRCRYPKQRTFNDAIAAVTARSGTTRFLSCPVCGWPLKFCCFAGPHKPSRLCRAEFDDPWNEAGRSGGTAVVIENRRKRLMETAAQEGQGQVQAAYSGKRRLQPLGRTHAGTAHPGSSGQRLDYALPGLDLSSVKPGDGRTPGTNPARPALMWRATRGYLAPN